MIQALQNLESPNSADDPLPAEDNDFRLVAAAPSQPELFDKLYVQHVDAVYRYMQVRAGSIDAPDLTQQVFLKAFASLPKYKARGLPFSAWLFRIARNLAIDHSRLRYRTTNELLPTIPQLDPSSSPEESGLRADTAASLRALIAQLDSEKRELLALRFAAGLNSRQIAAVVGKSEAGVKKQLTRILRTIKENHGE